MPSSTAPVYFELPDLVGHCKYPLRLNKHNKVTAAASEAWLDAEARFSEKRRRKFFGLKAGLLTSMCYPDCEEQQLRVTSDFMNYLFNLDDWSDQYDTEGTKGLASCVMNVLYHPDIYDSDANTPQATLARSFWKRFLLTGGPGCRQRFLSTFDMFFQAVTQQSLDRDNGIVPDLESYISMRRDTSGCKPVFVLMEYAAQIDLPDEVVEHPIIRDMEDATNDLVTWSNDIFSYNVEQSRGDNHNMICVLMQYQGLTLQAAVDVIGDLCKASIDRFESQRHNLPSWGPEIDAQVQTYVLGLQDWIAGSVHWSFMTERYFGKGGAEIKRSRRVELAPKVVKDASS